MPALLAPLTAQLENAIDAGATRIQVSLREGGIKALSVADNGSGIELEDLPIVRPARLVHADRQLCERHTTSKISSFDDLLELTTHGFRGEALASLSQVGHVTVTTRTAASPCGYRAVYAASQLQDGEGQDGAPKPVAATVGTTIVVEDLCFLD